MSIIVRQKKQKNNLLFSDIEVLKKAGSNLGLIVSEKKHYNKHAAEMQTKDCVFVFQHPQSQYEIGVFKEKDHYYIEYDAYGRDGRILEDIVGKPIQEGADLVIAPKLAQQYYVELFQKTAQEQGQFCQVTEKDGCFELEITVEQVL